MKTFKTQRRYPNNDWDYKAISTYITENGVKKDIVYYTLISKGVYKEGIEVFSGSNYIVGSKDRSYSKSYDINKLPLKYVDMLNTLKTKHIATKWYDIEYINDCEKIIVS
jgi:hypothetical protein